MNLLTSTSSRTLWEETIRFGEERCAVSLKSELEVYLVSLLMRYMTRPEVVKQLLARAFLEAYQQKEAERQYALQEVGDQCLLFAGLFPKLAEKRLVKINYFVDLGRSAYSGISTKTNDLFNLLAIEFVVLMDILQSIRSHEELLPLEAYDHWNLVGSQRALKILQAYTQGVPVKNLPD